VGDEGVETEHAKVVGMGDKGSKTARPSLIEPWKANWILRQASWDGCGQFEAPVMVDNL
jgi:hypothetical protein